MPNITQILAKIDQIKRNTAKNLQDPLGAIGLGLLRADEDFKQDPVKTVLGSANIGGGLLGMTKAVKLPKAPQADALETARRNAVEMLGLPENNTAMDRAKALGFDTPFYSGAQSFNYGTEIQPIWGSTNPTVANTYTKGRGRSGGASGPQVLPLLAMSKNSKVVDAGGRPFSSFEYIDDYGQIAGGSTDSVVKETYQSAKDKIKPLPDSIVFKNIVDPGSGTFPQSKKKYEELLGDTVFAINPSKVRSRFAVFDPARVNENNLLASRLLPFAVPGLLGAYGMDNE